MITALFKAFTMLGSEWVMWLLMLLSIVSLAVVFERIRGLSSQEKLGSKLWKDHLQNMLNGPQTTRDDILKKSDEIGKNYPCFEAKLLVTLAQNKSKSADELELIAQSFINKNRLELDKNLSFLGTVGSNAPFIGLFGTVLGIIKAFHDLGGKVESAGAQTISSGISEALVATAIGLLVAIPAVIAFNYFQRKIKLIMGRSESLSQYMQSLR